MKTSSLFALLGLSKAAIINGKCPDLSDPASINFEVVQNLDFKRFTGTWYPITADQEALKYWGDFNHRCL